MPDTKIYFCATDYAIADALEIMDNTVYETSMEEWLKLTKEIFRNPEKYIDTECTDDIPLAFGTDSDTVHQICKAMFEPFSDDYPTSITKINEVIKKDTDEEGAENTLKVA